MLKGTPVKYSTTPRGRDSVCTIQVMESNEFKIIQRETQIEMSSIPLLPTKSVWLCPSVETGAVYVAPRNNCLLLPCVLKVLS